ncbi:unnamed protein product, partial [Cylicostephanus goldi]
MGHLTERDLQDLSIPTINEALAKYAELRGVQPIDPSKWAFYVAFVFYRFANLLPMTPQALSKKAQKLYTIVKDIVHTDILPIEQELLRYQLGPDRWIPHPKLEEIKKKAKSLGAWNLFISEHIDPDRSY